MDINKVKQIKVFLIVLGMYTCTLFVSIFITILYANMMSNLVLLVLYLLIFSIYFKQMYKEYTVYRKEEGVIVKEPKPRIATLALSISIVVIVFYNINVVMLNSNTFSLLMLAYLFGSYCLLYDNDPLIIFGDNAMYFKHRWIPYSEIIRLDTDKTNKQRIVVYVFANRCYSQPLSKDMYEQFEKVRQAYMYH